MLNRVGAVVYVLSYLIKTAFVANQSFTDPFKKNKTQIFAIKRKSGIESQKDALRLCPQYCIALSNAEYHLHCHFYVVL